MVDHAEAAKQSMTPRRVGGATLLGFQRSRWVSGHRQTIWRCYDCHRDLHYRVSISKLGTRGHRSMAVIHAPSSRLKRRSLHSRRCSAGRAAIYCRRSHRLRSAAVAPRRGKSTSVEVGEGTLLGSLRSLLRLVLPPRCQLTGACHQARFCCGSRARPYSVATARHSSGGSRPTSISTTVCVSWRARVGWSAAMMAR